MRCIRASNEQQCLKVIYSIRPISELLNVNVTWMLRYVNLRLDDTVATLRLACFGECRFWEMDSVLLNDMNVLVRCCLSMTRTFGQFAGMLQGIMEYTQGCPRYCESEGSGWHSGSACRSIGSGVDVLSSEGPKSKHGNAHVWLDRVSPWLVLWKLSPSVWCSKDRSIAPSRACIYLCFASSMYRPLRAYPISPRRLVPDHIPRPEWASTVVLFPFPLIYILRRQCSENVLSVRVWKDREFQLQFVFLHESFYTHISTPVAIHKLLPFTDICFSHLYC